MRERKREEEKEEEKEREKGGGAELGTITLHTTCETYMLHALLTTLLRYGKEKRGFHAITMN